MQPERYHRRFSARPVPSLVLLSAKRNEPWDSLTGVDCTFLVELVRGVDAFVFSNDGPEGLLEKDLDREDRRHR